MRHLYYSLLLLAIVTFASTEANAQVTIGANTPPQSFSVLELISGGNKGLRLPQLTTQQRDDLQATFGSKATAEAMGLQIFNTKTKCVETWNGAAWIQTCPPSGPVLPPVSPSIPASCGITPASGNNTTYTAKADPNVEAYEFFVGGVSQGEQTGNVLTLGAAVAASSVTVAYLYPPAFLKPVMKDVAGNGGSTTWYYGTTPPGTATTVSIPDFKMSETLVTQAQFSAVMGVNPAYFQCGGTGASNVACRPTSALPVEYVNWYAAIAYCNKLSIMEGKTPVYTVAGVSDWDALTYAQIPDNTATNATWDAVTCNFAANGYRLPTESEWEYAARGGTANVHPVFSGSYYAGDYTTAAASDSLSLVAWWGTNNGNSSGCNDITPYGTKPVKGKRANVFGLYDMSGNVSEWCWNWNNETLPMATPSATVASTGNGNPVIRGSDWGTTFPLGFLVSNRGSARSYTRYYIGIRVVLGH